MSFTHDPVSQAGEKQQDTFAGWAILDDVWRPITGYESEYEVNGRGDIRSLYFEPPRALKQSPYRNGYRKVQLWLYGQWRNVGVHQLVAAAFLGPCPAGQEVNHKDGQKSNNHYTNLEYVTRSENLAHAYRTGLRSSAKGTTTAKRRPRAWIGCQCGCGQMLESPDPKGRRRRYVSGHNLGGLHGRR